MGDFDTMKITMIAKLLALLFLAAGGVAHAQGGTGNLPPGGGGFIQIPDPLGCPSGEGILCVLDRVLDALFALSIPIAAIMVLIGGFLIMTAGGETEKLSTGKKTILYAAVGFAVILLAEGLVAILQSLLTEGA